jgi:hypothetical protein
MNKPLPDTEPAQDEHLAVLCEIRDELRALRQTLTGRPAGTEDAAPPLIEAIADVFGNDDWTAASLMDEASSPFAYASELRKAIIAAVGRDPKGQVRRLGIFIARHVGWWGDLHLEACAKSRDGAVYRITRA